MELFYARDCPFNPDITLVIEDDEKVAYAYLCEKGKIVSDVWLYNSIPTPEIVDWQNPEDLPFLNPREYTKDQTEKTLPFEEDEIEIKWSHLPIFSASIYYRRELFAILTIDSKPGWSLLAAKSNSIAIPLELFRNDKSLNDT